MILSNDTIISLRDISVAYQNTVALYDVNIDIFKNDFIGICGSNGSGKTTLLKTILGAVKPFKGNINILGKDINDLGRKEKFKIGYVPQIQPIDRNFPALVEDVVAMGRYAQVGIFHKFKDKDKTLITNALEMIDMLDYACRPIGHLSGGQQQKVWIARALAQDAEILLLDEPVSALDFKMTKSVLELLRKLNEENEKTIIMILHNIKLLKEYTKRLICLNKTIFFDGSPQSPEADREIERIFFM